MNPTPIASFDYFVGKVCTIHTRQINWTLKPENIIDYFVGVVDLVNECGICLTNVIDGRKTFIMMPAVVAIAEETVLEDKSQHTPVLKEYEEKKKELFGKNQSIYPPKPVQPKKPVTKLNDDPFVNIASVRQCAQTAQEKLKK